MFKFKDDYQSIPKARGYLILLISLIFSLNLFAKENCEECSEATKPLQKDQLCKDNDFIYQACSDQLSKVKTKITFSIDNQKVLLMVFGANWCPPCQKADQNFQELELSSDVFDYAEIVHIGLSDIQFRKSQTGEEVLSYLINQYQFQHKIIAFPTVVAFNFNNNKSKSTHRLPKDLTSFEKTIKNLIESVQ
jgi:thiol-disulfide isomerase/thioredoxin